MWKKIKGRLAFASNITIAGFYRASWHGLLAVMFLLLLSAKAFPLWFAILSGSLCAYSLDPEIFGRGHRWKVPHWLPFVFLGLILSVTGLLFFFVRDIVSLIAGALLAFVPVFLARRQKTFGHWIALMTASLLALLGVIAGGAFSQFFLFFVFLTFVVFHLNAANLLLLAGNATGRRLRLAPGYFSQLVPSLVVGFAIGVIIFVVFPRSQVFSNPFNLQPRSAMTQYTGNVSLNGKGVISESSLLAMLIETEDVDWLAAAGSKLYFRGNAHDFFDGVNWSSPARALWTYDSSSDIRISSVFAYPPRRLRIFREPHSTEGVIYPNVLFGIELPVKLLGGLSYDANGSLVRGHKEIIRYSYDVLAADAASPGQIKDVPLSSYRDVLMHSTGRRPMTAKVSRDRLPQLLQIPDSVRKDGIFRAWVREVGVDTNRMTISGALAMLRRNFEDRFQATLVNKISGEGSLLKFLLARKGHCEYFATAAVLFLRDLGVPARLVLGYHGGLFNNVSRVFEVREKHAHAWVEVYYPSSGWVTFEATPMAATEMLSGWALYYEVYLNAARFWFNRYVINYNSETQAELARRVAGGAAGLKAASRLPGTSQYLVWTLLVVVCLVGVRRRWYRTLFPTHARSVLPQYYQLFLKKTSKAGYQRNTGETLKCFHHRLGRAGFDRFVLKAVNEAIEEDLYSPSPRSVEERTWLTERLKALSPPEQESASN